jgi:hypothetical protein
MSQGHNILQQRILWRVPSLSTPTSVVTGASSPISPITVPRQGSGARTLTVHAAKRTDGSIAVMLINKRPKEKSTVKLQVAGAKLAADGFRFDWGQNSPAGKYPVTREAVTGIGNLFSVVVPPYTITNIIIPAKP